MENLSTETKIALGVGRLTPWVIVSSIVALLALALAYGAIRLASREKPSNEIVLRDEAGRPRVRITATAQGGAIELLDENGRARIALQQVDEELSFSMHRKERKAHDDYDFGMQLSVNEGAGYAGIKIYEPTDGTLATLDGEMLALKSPFASGYLMASAELGTHLGLRYRDRKASVALGIGPTRLLHDGRAFILENDKLAPWTLP